MGRTHRYWLNRIIHAFRCLREVVEVGSGRRGTIKLGYPVSVVLPLGLVLLACTVLYAIPRTAVLGAILLTGYLGGAVATQVRVQSASFWFAVLFGVLVWLGLYLRDSQVRALIPLRK